MTFENRPAFPGTDDPFSNARQAIEECLANLASHLPSIPGCNLLPYGRPGGREPKLILILDGKFDVSEILAAGLKHATSPSDVLTQAILIFVAVDETTWAEAWDLYEGAYALWEDLGGCLKIHFSSHP